MAKTKAKKQKSQKRKSRVHLPAVSPTQQRALLRDVDKLLAARGVVGKIAELRLHALGAAVVANCPPGTTKQVVCRKQPDGTVICQEECV